MLSSELTFVNFSRREWQKKLRFPYSNVKAAKLKLFDLELEKDRLKSLADLLVMQWKSQFPRTSVPIYLTRVSDRSLSTLRWRRSKTHSDKASQVTLSENMLEYFYIEKQRNAVFKFESLRLDLNHQLSIVLYEIQRLTIYISDTKNLSMIRNKQ